MKKFISYFAPITLLLAVALTPLSTIYAQDLSCTIVQDNPVSVIGGNDGQATVTVSGGTAPYSYSWGGTATSLDFDGVDNGTGSYVDIGAFSLTSYTKEAWIKWDGTEFLQHNIISGSINGSQHAFWVVGDELRSGHSGNYLALTDTDKILPNIWYHCAVTYDGDTGLMSLYKDGVLVAFNTLAPGFIMEGTYIGAFGNSSDELVAVMSGQIDDARVWNYVRTQSEIQADMNSCLSGTEIGLEALYDFEDGTGSTTLSNKAGNGNNGILMNMDPATDWVMGKACGNTGPTATGLTAGVHTATITDADGSVTSCDVTIEEPNNNTCTEFDSNDFETGWGIWNGSGDDALLTSGFSAYANSGSYVVRIRDNSGADSSMYTDNLDMSAYGALEVSFSYMTTSMEIDEDFFLEVSTDGGVSYTIVQSWVSGIDFDNETRYDETVTISGTFSENTVLRIRCDASLNGDMVFIDDVVINTCGSGTPTDTDGDGIADAEDNCPLVANADQADLDGDGLGDVCDACPSDPLNDSDGDGVCDSVDICPGFDDSADSDGDTVPDGCDSCVGDDASGDTDGDGVCDAADICPGFDDSVDSDGDTVPDGCDSCIGDDASGDTDGDGVCDSIDNCIDIPNADQADSDGDGIGDVCECADSDGDGVCDSVDICPGFDDSADSDGDTVPDGCDTCVGDDASGDTDGDGICDSADICPGFDDSTDSDGDTVPDGCDSCTGDDASGDTDGDGVCDSIDNCIDIPNADQADSDSDGIGDVCECPDSDGDGVCDAIDNCIDTPNPDQVDVDNDGIGDICDDVIDQSCSEFDSNDFETGWGIWNGSGDDALLTKGFSAYANSGKWVIRIRDDSGADSSMYTDNLDMSAYGALEVSFSYMTTSMEIDEDFFLEVSTDGGVSYTIVQSWVSGIDFDNETRYDETVTISGTFSENTVLRIRCDASLNGDMVFIDDVVINTCGSGTPTDTDGDGIADAEDNCPLVANADQADLDGDGLGDVCDACPTDPLNDSDGDGVCDSVDICPGFDDSADSDGDTVPDGCDSCVGDDASGDTDGDGVCDAADICPGFDDSVDSDGDTVPDGCDSCIGDDASGDTDGDGVCDSIDNCIDIPNADQADSDGDGIGDVCECADSDGDGVCDSVDICPGFDDSADSDGDTVPDGCDICTGDDASGDTDGDGICDSADICPGFDDSTDSDGDTVPDGCDSCTGDDASGDTDGDGVCDSIDNCIDIPNADQADSDGDGIGDVCECPDSDGDGVCDAIDNCIDTPNPDQVDVDNDGIGDICDDVIDQSCSEFDSNDFETGWGIWNGSGDDALLTKGFSAYANSGKWVIRIRDDSGADSSMYTDDLDMSAYGALEVSFSYMTTSMEIDEDFFLEVSTDGGVSYTIVQSWVSGIDFDNETRYDETVTISGTFSENTVLRIRCDASLNGDMVFIDDVVINTCGSGTPTDTDGDGIADAEDNCPLVANADQADLDGDGLGDVCDACPSDPLNDSDGDGVCDSVDICPGFDDSADSDGDTVPDGCDTCVGDDASGDTDGDGVCDAADICPGFDDSVDSDGDTVPDGCDSCIGDDASGDTDGDGVCDSIDNCIDIPNADQADSDGDGIGDVCECADSDGDGVCDSVDICPGFDDSADSDGDTVPDGCDICTGDDASGDTDGDGVCDAIDNCIDTPNPDQVDVDNDGIGDICDPVIDQSCSESDLSCTIVQDNPVSVIGGNDGQATVTVSGGTAPYSYSWGGTATSLDFDGVDNGTGSYVDIGAFSLTSYTKEAWIKWDGTEFLQHNIISGSINGSQHAFWVVGDELRSGHSGNYLALTDTDKILPNIWYHCAVTYDGDTGLMSLYKDGVLVAFNTLAPGFIMEGTYIGAFGNSSDELVAVMSGQIDDARVWNYVRTQSEIQADMNSCLSGTETGLEALYDFEDGTGSTTLSNKAGNGNNGILMNMDPATDWVMGKACGNTGPTATGLTAGDYTVTVTDAAGCTTTCDVTIDYVDTCSEFDSNDFETGWGIWNGSGDDALLTKGFSAYANSGKWVIRLRDDSGADSSMYTDDLDMSSYSALEVSFSYMTTSMEIDEDFFLEVSTDGGVSYTIVQSWVSGIDFDNETRYDETVAITGTFSENTVLRIRCDASLNGDMVYIDDVVIKTCGSSPLRKAFDQDASIQDLVKVMAWPNPSETSFNLGLVSDTELGKVKVSVFDSSHKLIHSGAFDSKGTYVFGANFDSGVYTVKLVHATGVETVRIIKE